MGPAERPSNAPGSSPRPARPPGPKARRARRARHPAAPAKTPARLAALELQRIHARRLRACRSLGLSVPRDAAEGPPETLLRRIALLDRRIEVSLDLAGGVRFPAWTNDEEEEPGDEESGGAFS